MRVGVGVDGVEEAYICILVVVVDFICIHSAFKSALELFQPYPFKESAPRRVSAYAPKSPNCFKIFSRAP